MDFSVGWCFAHMSLEWLLGVSHMYLLGVCQCTPCLNIGTSHCWPLLWGVGAQALLGIANVLHQFSGGGCWSKASQLCLKCILFPWSTWPCAMGLCRCVTMCLPFVFQFSSLAACLSLLACSCFFVSGVLLRRIEISNQ